MCLPMASRKGRLSFPRLSMKRNSRSDPSEVCRSDSPTATTDGNGEISPSCVRREMRTNWPSQSGDIDLNQHDLPHDECSTEWWYFNSHFQAKPAAGTQGKAQSFSFFASFFRVIKHVDEDGTKHFGHALTWALIDPLKKEYYSDVSLEKDAPKVMLAAMEKSSRVGPSDPLIRRALVDVLKKGRVPLPDRLMTTDGKCSRSKLSLDYGGSTLIKNRNGSYALDVNAPNGVRCQITFSPKKQAIRHGDNGVVKGHENEDEDMFYYFIPRCSMTGRIVLQANKQRKQAESFEIIPGKMSQGWYDHEFGGVSKKQSDEIDLKQESQTQYAWNWVAVQLDEPQIEISAAMLMDPKANRVMEIKAVVVNERGERFQYDGVKGEFCFEQVNDKMWTSLRTFRRYPLVFNLSIPALNLDLVLDASAHPDQEFMTLLSKPAFWEGRIEATGTYNNKIVHGLGFLERNGFDQDQNISQFFKSVGVAVRDSVQDLYPLNPTHEQIVELVANKETAHYVDDVPGDILGQTLMAPVRLIADRGGKSWRSYAALACVDAVGGDSRKYAQFLAMPEFLHVGSLIVDDIQDKSATRRGGPCAHLVFGEPLSINAGTAAYFQTEQLLYSQTTTPDIQIKLYKLYFAALRAGHAGQALDIYGNDYLMDEVVESGDAKLLEARICAIHRLKTAVPAGTLARMGCTIGGGSDAQIEAVGRFMEAVGVAFQIMDDVLNLRGIYSNKADKKESQGKALKTVGEDIMDGKVTMPVCQYMALELNQVERKRIWESIKAKPQDQETVQGIIDDMEKLGAVDACVGMSKKIVTEAWERVDAEIADSFAKMMLRSFGHFVTENSGG